MDFKITNLGKQHKDKLHSLIEEINQEDNLSYSITEEWLDYVIDNAGEGIFVVLDGEKLVGLATAMINPLYREQGALNVVVSPEYRRKGLGTFLYNKIHDFTKQENVKIVEVYVKERLTSGVRFAEKRGFQAILFSWEMEIDIENVDFNFEKYPELNFRKANQEDRLSYKKIINDAFGDEVGLDALDQGLKDPSISIYMLKKENKAVGSATIQIKEDLSLAYIYDIAILKEYNGQGLGSYLLKSCIMVLKDKNIKRASLLVTGENKRALDLYKKIGFKETDVDLIMTKKMNN